MKSIVSILSCVFATLLFTAFCHAADLPLADQVESLEPVLGGYPPNINSQGEFDRVKETYETLKARLDALLAEQPRDQELLFLRGHLQAMGHNFDYPLAYEGAADDLQTLLEINPDHVAAMLELAGMWVNSEIEMAAKAEALFRKAQCCYGDQPLEAAQNGVYFALYYQGDLKGAFRQSEYLVTTWPENEAYRSQNDVVRTVLERQNIDVAPLEVPADQRVMARCQE